jgi:hypothetical protein
MMEGGGTRSGYRPLPSPIYHLYPSFTAYSCFPEK